MVYMLPFHCCFIKDTVGIGTECAACKSNRTLNRHCDAKLSLTYCRIIGSDINQDLRGASSTNISVAVPHTGNQVRLAKKITTLYSFSTL